MSLDLSWSLLDDEFVSGLVEKLNRSLTEAKRPDYIGPITVSNLVLGSDAPEIDIVDVGDVWPAFLQRTEASEVDPRPSAQQHADRAPESTVGSRQSKKHPPGQHTTLVNFANRNLPFTGMANSINGENTSENSVQDGSRRHLKQSKDPRRRFQSFRQYSDSGKFHRIETGSMTSFNDSGTPWSVTTPTSSWGAGLQTFQGGGYFSAWQGAPAPLAPQSVRSASIDSKRKSSTWQRHSSAALLNRPIDALERYDGPWLTDVPSSVDNDGVSSQNSTTLPSIQLTLSLQWATQTFRLSLETSLVINHPSPAFMSLPLSITVTGLALQAGGQLAFEVDPMTNERRAHFCLFVEEDEADPNSNPATGNVTTGNFDAMHGRAPDAFGVTQAFNSYGASTGTGSDSPHFGNTADPANSPGERILHSITLDSSVGQADRHMLKNVAKVERFVVSLVRKAVSDEVRFCLSIY